MRDLQKKRDYMRKYHKALPYLPLVYALRDMRRRCNRPDHKDWPNYGGRGIKVLFNSLKEFREWATGAGWCKGLVLDRIDNDGHYEPSNLRWVTWPESNANRRQ